MKLNLKFFTSLLLCSSLVLCTAVGNSAAHTSPRSPEAAKITALQPASTAGRIGVSSFEAAEHPAAESSFGSAAWGDSNSEALQRPAVEAGPALLQGEFLQGGSDGWREADNPNAEVDVKDPVLYAQMISQGWDQNNDGTLTQGELAAQQRFEYQKGGNHRPERSRIRGQPHPARPRVVQRPDG